MKITSVKIMRLNSNTPEAFGIRWNRRSSRGDGRGYLRMGGGTLIFAVMSAIDIALSDIKGKSLGVTVHQLLGGKTNDRLRSYASQIQFDWSAQMKPMVEPEQYAEATRKAVAGGFEGEFRQAMANLLQVLTEHGCTLRQVVKTTTCLRTSRTSTA